MSRKIGRACGKIILSGNTANRFGRKALAVPVELYITCTCSNTDSPRGDLRIVWPGHRGMDIWLNTVRKIIKLIEEDIGSLSGNLSIRNTLPLARGMGSSTAIVIALARCFFGENCKAKALAIEDIINKGHSGLDFAAIWEERTVVAQGDRYEFIDLPKGLQRGVLVDTGIPSAPTSVIIGNLKERLPKDRSLMDSVEAIGDCTERLLSGEDPLTVFPDHYNWFVKLGVVPPRVRTLIEKIQRSGGAAKPGRFGAATGGAGMLFAVHPNLNTLIKIVGTVPVSLVYNPAVGRFVVDQHYTGTARRELVHASRSRKQIATARHLRQAR